MSQAILTLNAGSSSLKFSLFTFDEALTLLAEGRVTNISERRAGSSEDEQARHNPGMQAVSFEIVHFIDIDRSRKNRSQQPKSGRICLRDQDIQHFIRFDPPLGTKYLPELTVRR